MCPARRLAAVASGSPSAIPSLRVAIIGGGFAGAVAALRLMEAGSGPLAITVVEPRERLGRGAAYATPDLGDVMDATAGSLSLYPEAPLHFARWLEAEATRGGWRPAEGIGWDVSQPPRWHFGSYVENRLAATAADNFGRVRLRHRRARAVGVGRLGREFVVALDEGGTLLVDVVVLASGVADGAGPGDPLVRTLLDRGLARRSGTGSGIEVDPLTLAVVAAAGGTGAGRLFAIGHRLRGPVWASTSVREIAVEARTLGETVAGLGEIAARERPAIRRGA